MSPRGWVASLAHRRAVRLFDRNAGAALRWLRLGARIAPGVSDVHRELVSRLKQGEDRWGAVHAARAVIARFDDDPEAWLLMGDAYLGVYRQQDALNAYEHALALEERADAAMAAGALYRRLGYHVDAAARFARAHAAGAGPEALIENARSLRDAGDHDAAEAALRLWATEVPDGAARLDEMRERLAEGRR